MKIKNKIISLIPVLVLLIVSGFIFGIINHSEVTYEPSENYQMPLNSMASNITISPTILQDNIPILDYFPFEDEYYYRTNTFASSNFFHVVWVNPVDPLDDFLLQLHTNSTYNDLVMQVGSWFIARPNVSQQLNIAIVEMDNGSYYVGWESCSTIISPGESATGTIAISDMIEAYSISFDNTHQYRIGLTVPATADFDLYIYYPNYIGKGFTLVWDSNPPSSTTTGLDIDEDINEWTPEATGEHIILIVWKEGAGSYTLTTECLDCAIPINNIFIVIGITTVIVLYIRKRKKPFKINY